MGHCDVNFLKFALGAPIRVLLEHVAVKYYGSEVPLNQVASISVLDVRTLSVSPWDKSASPDIEKAILNSDLGLNPVTTGEVMRVPLPALTEERRRELTRLSGRRWKKPGSRCAISGATPTII